MTYKTREPIDLNDRLKQIEQLCKVNTEQDDLQEKKTARLCEEIKTQQIMIDKLSRDRTEHANSARLYQIQLQDCKRSGQEEETRLKAEIVALEIKYGSLVHSLNHPNNEDLFLAVSTEATYQLHKFGKPTPQTGQEPLDWLGLIQYLSTKAAKAALAFDNKKLLHHIVSTSAVLMHWHRHVTTSTQFVPGEKDDQ